MPRPRALSLPLIEAQPYQQTLSQPRSDFFTKLPLEIRRLIYAKALGGNGIHFRTEDGKPRAMKCAVRGECICAQFSHEESPSLGLGLLRTCRIVYSEAIEYLYSANSFSLATLSDHLHSADYLSYYFLPQRLIQIQSLHIDWKVDSLLFHPIFELEDINFEPWLNSWKILSGLTGLRRLHIRLGYARSFWAERLDAIWEEHGPKMLEVVRDITAPKDFVVVLPSPHIVADMDVGSSHCVFKEEKEEERPIELSDYF